MYFEWMNYLNIWLCIPSCLAIGVFFVHYFEIMEIETSPLGGLFSMMMAVWGTLYVCFWRRHCRGLMVLWDCGGNKNEAEHVRKEFQGELQFDPITDGMSRHFSSL